jgi:hypothetical protein
LPAQKAEPAAETVKQQPALAAESARRQPALAAELEAEPATRLG